MKGVSMYHQIKSLRRCYSVRECARRLGVSVNTVRKYDGMNLSESASYFETRQRSSQFDVARDFIIERLSQFPKISAVKLLRQVKEKHPEIQGKVRAFRYYLAPLRSAANPATVRHYAPVLDMVPGHQVQVDGGEFRVARPDDAGFKVYFIAFVCSYSRRLFVTFRQSPFDTTAFIRAHQEAFVYFGGVAKEYVYDQTKLVVINERYREVFLNERFHQFAVQHEFTVHVCEGYDPESKGKVERSIRYIKESFLYGDYFSDLADVQERARQWLDTVANVRIHGVTGQRPVDLFAEEAPLLSQRYTVVNQSHRHVDKTGLLSFEGNKYSAPFAYQRQDVAVERVDRELILRDIESGAELACHPIPDGRGQIIRNNNHYRDYKKSLAELTASAQKSLQAIPDGAQLIERLLEDNPRIGRDQLRGLITLSTRFEPAVWNAALPLLLRLPRVRMTRIESILADYDRRRQAASIDNDRPDLPVTSGLDRPLEYYQEVIHA